MLQDQDNSTIVIQPYSVEQNKAQTTYEEHVYIPIPSVKGMIAPTEVLAAPKIPEQVSIPQRHKNKLPVNIQEYAEFVAEQKGLKTPSNSVSNQIQETQTYAKCRFLRAYNEAVQFSLLPASGIRKSVTFFCPFCQTIEQSKVTKNGCCFPKSIFKTTVRRQSQKAQLVCYLLASILLPHLAIILLIAYIYKGVTLRNNIVHLCPGCERLCGFNMDD